MEFLFILLFGLASVALVGGGILVSRLASPRRPNKVKGDPYECGEQTIGPSWVHFNVGYYLFALLFLVFEVEAAFLFPWAVIFREIGLTGLISAFVFIFVLLLALIYAWKKGILEWV